MKPESSYNQKVERKENCQHCPTNGQKTTVVGRVSSNTLQKFGLLLSAISGALLTAPLILPPLLTTIATVIGIFGGLITSISKIIYGVNENKSGLDNPAAVLKSPLLKKGVDKKPFAKHYFAKNFS